jgi:hypothetical protein
LWLIKYTLLYMNQRNYSCNQWSVGYSCGLM